MNAKEYSDQFPFDGDVQSGFVIMSETDLIQVMEEYANHYHQTQVKNNVALDSVSGMFPALNTVRQEIDKYNEKTIQGNKGHFQNGINWAFNHIAKQIKK